MTEDLGAKLKAERKRRKELMMQRKNIESGTKEEQKQGNEIGVEYRNHLNDKIDSSLDRSLKMVDASQTTGTDTLEMLDHQRQQLKHAHKVIHETNEILKDSDRSLQTVESNWMRGARQKNGYKGMKTNNEIKEKKKKHSPKHKKKKESKENNTNLNHSKERKINKWTDVERKQQQIEKLQQIDGYINNLQSMAITMGNEMESQKPMIEEVQFELEDLDYTLERKNRRMNRILHK